MNYTAIISFAASKFKQQIHIESFIADIYQYLYMLPQEELYVMIKLNKHKNKSALQRYIDSCTTTYRGEEKSMLIYNIAKPMNDIYMSFRNWETNKPQINYAKYIRNQGKIILNILISSKYSNYKEPITKDIQTQLTKIFIAWYNSEKNKFFYYNIMNGTIPNNWF